MVSVDVTPEFVYDAYSADVYRYFLRRTRDVTDSEDLTADVFAVVIKKCDRIPADGVLPWLYKTAANVLAHHYRSRSRRQALLEKLKTTLPSVSSTWSPVQMDVFQALESLSAADAELLRLVSYERLSNADLGLVLGVSEDVAKKRKSRALQRLRDSLSVVSGSEGKE